MSEIKVKTIEPSTGTNLTLGAAGDAISVASDSLKVDVWKDSGGNTLFQSDGAGTVTNVNSAIAGSGPKLISTQTFTDQATVSFTTGIDSTYDEYMWVFIDLKSDTDQKMFQVNFSSGGGTTYAVTKTSTFWRAYNNANDTGSGLGYINPYGLANSTGNQYLNLDNSSDATHVGVGTLKLYNPSSTTYVKHYMFNGNTVHYANITMNNYSGGFCDTTSAVNAAQFSYYAGNFAGTISLYGIA